MKKPWISKGILKSIEKRTEFAEHALELKMVQKRRIAQSFRFYRNLQNKISRISKPNHYKNFFEVNKNKLSKVWQGIKEMINIKKKSTQQNTNINNNGKLITGKKQIANTFNHFFCDILQ